MAHSSSGSLAIEKFLTPEGMLTPGIAGSVVMTITNTLAPAFSWQRSWVALGLSFIVGLLVFAANQGMLAKLVFYVLNSLVVFTVAFGANSTAVALGNEPSVALAIVTSAAAQDVAADDLVALQSQINDLGAQYDALTARIDAARQRNAAPAEIDALVAEQKAIDAQRSDLVAKLVSSAVQTQQIVPPSDKFFSPWKF